MSVRKSNSMVKGPRGVKSRIWTLETLSIWLVKLILSITFFFTFLYVANTQWNIADDLTTHFVGVFLIYVISGIISFLLSYIIIKYLFGRFMRRQVKDFSALMRGKRRMKKLWIYIFSIIFRTIFFILSINLIIANEIPLPDNIAYILAWFIVYIGSKVLGRILFFIFYTW